jgi:hypothetical protein
MEAHTNSFSEVSIRGSSFSHPFFSLNALVENTHGLDLGIESLIYDEILWAVGGLEIFITKQDGFGIYRCCSNNNTNPESLQLTYSL